MTYRFKVEVEWFKYMPGASVVYYIETEAGNEKAAREQIEELCEHETEIQEIKLVNKKKG